MLRSISELRGYAILASGSLGHVEDLVVDDETWMINSFVIDTRNWLPGKKVMIAAPNIWWVNWADRQVRVNLSKAAIKDAPAYDSSAPINQEIETRLHDYHGRPRSDDF